LAGRFGKELLLQTEKANAIIVSLEKERTELLDQNRSLQSSSSVSIISSLKESLDVKTQELEELREQLKAPGIEEIILHMRADLAKSERLLEEERRKYRQLFEEFSELQARDELCQAQLRESENFITTLQSTSEILKKDNQQYLHFEEKIDLLTKENRKLQDEVDELKGQKGTLDKFCADLKQEVSQQLRLVKRLSDEKDGIEKERNELSQQIREMKNVQGSDAQKRISDLKTIKEELEKTRAEVSAIKKEKKMLEDHCISLTKENQVLYKEKEENKAFLDEAQQTVKRLQSAMEENDISNSTSSPSLLGELGAEINKRIELQEKKNESKNKESTSSAAAAGMANCEEYFFLVHNCSFFLISLLAK